MRLLALVLLVLTGCSTTMTATYRNPETHDVAICQRPPQAYGWGLIGLFAMAGNVVDGHRYAACKTQLEERGFVREGTR